MAAADLAPADTQCSCLLQQQGLAREASFKHIRLICKNMMAVGDCIC